MLPFFCWLAPLSMHRLQDFYLRNIVPSAPISREDSLS